MGSGKSQPVGQARRGTRCQGGYSHHLRPWVYIPKQHSKLLSSKQTFFIVLLKFPPSFLRFYFVLPEELLSLYSVLPRTIPSSSSLLSVLPKTTLSLVSSLSLTLFSQSQSAKAVSYFTFTMYFIYIVVRITTN